MKCQWIETGNKIIKDDDPSFKEMKEKFLNHAKETNNWKLVYANQYPDSP